MNRQKLYPSLYEKRKIHASKQPFRMSMLPQERFQLPAIVNPPAYLSTREKLWLSTWVCFTILSIVLAIIGVQAGTRHATVATSSSPTSPTPTQITTILNPPPVSIGKRPATPTPVSPVKPTPITLNPVPTACPGVNCNPWGYNFIPGNLIYNPPAGFCNYFACVPNFYKPHDPGNGYIVECNDGMYSPSGGGRGTCLHHGAILRPLYTH